MYSTLISVWVLLELVIIVCNIIRYVIGIVLPSNTSCTLPFENQKNIYRFTVSPDGMLMISVDEGTIILDSC